MVKINSLNWMSSCLLGLILLSPLCMSIVYAQTNDDPFDLNNRAIPKRAQNFLMRYHMCLHFSGEFSGDRSEHDRYVNRRMDLLGCARIDAEIARERKRYPNNVVFIERVRRLDEDYMDVISGDKHYE